MSAEKQLRATLERYGRHDADCSFQVGDECTCGFIEAMTSIPLECSVGDCEKEPVVGVRWIGDDKDCFQFCDEHDPRKVVRENEDEPPKIPDALFESLVRCFKLDQPFKISFARGVDFNVRLRTIEGGHDDVDVRLVLHDIHKETA